MKMSVMVHCCTVKTGQSSNNRVLTNFPHLMCWFSYNDPADALRLIIFLALNLLVNSNLHLQPMLWLAALTDYA